MSHMYLNIYPKTDLIMNNVIKHLSVRIIIFFFKKNRLYINIRLDLIGEEVEKKLVEEPFNFQKKIIPVDADPAKDPHSYIYMT